MAKNVENINIKNLIKPEGYSLIYKGGTPTKKVLLIFHGFTNCPMQYKVLGEQFYTAGYSVYIPRIPYHGLIDDTLQKNITPQLLEDFAEQSLDFARTLGDEVVVTGISGGANLALYCWANHREINDVLLTAPLLSIRNIPPLILKILALGMHIIPNSFIWWDKKRKANHLGPYYAYARFSTKALAAFYQVGIDAMKKVKKDKLGNTPRNIIHTVTFDDEAVNNAYNISQLKLISNITNCKLETYTFPEELHLKHDIIDPNQLYAKPEIVYPQLIQLLGNVT
jgi:esterase/lipase